MNRVTIQVAFALACAIGMAAVAANEVGGVQTVLVDPAVRPAAPNAGAMALGRPPAKVLPDSADIRPLPLPERIGPKIDVPRGQLVTWDVRTRTITIEDGPPSAHPAQPSARMPGGFGGAVRPKSAPGDSTAPLSFTEMTKVTGTEAYPYSAAVKLLMRFGSSWYVASGAMIDPMNVLTAGHCVFDHGGTNAFADEMIVTPAYVSSVGPFGTANGVRMRSWTGWTTKGSFDHDIGLIELDRPVGALCGWHGYGYSDSPSFFTGGSFFCPGYPAESPYDGQFMFNWSGSFDATDYFANKWRGNEVTIYRRAYGGQSGSGAATVTGVTRTVYCVLSNGNSYLTNLPRITSDKFLDIRDGWIEPATPSTPDLVPLNVNAVPASITAGSQLTTLNCLVHNYSSATWGGAVTLQVYLSTDDTITASDSLIHTHSAELSLAALSSARVQFTVPPTIPFTGTGGTRYLGVIVQAAGEADSSNHQTNGWDAAKLTITPRLAAPDTVAASDGEFLDHVRIAWPAVPDATHYMVYRGTTAVGPREAITGWQTVRTFDDTAPAPGATRYYWMKAAASSAGAAASDYGAADTGWRALSPPASLTADWFAMEPDWISLAWEPSAGAAFYRVYRSEASGGTPTPVADWQPTAYLQDTTAPRGVLSWYRVAAAIDEFGTHESGFSNEASAVMTPGQALSVASSPVLGVIISGDAPGTTSYQASCPFNQNVTLSAEMRPTISSITWMFLRWTIDGAAQPDRQATVAFTMDRTHALTAEYVISGDANGDCRINVLDLIAARNRLNQSAGEGTNWRADANGDSTINVLDLIYVRNRVGLVCP